MEYGILVNDVGPLPADPRDICRASWRSMLPEGALRAIYFGAEFCADLLPEASRVAEFCIHASGHAIEPVLLTPIATPQGLERIRRLLTEITRSALTPTVVFNDWGVSELLQESFPKLRRHAGRLINRGLRDPRLMEKMPESESAPGDRAGRLRALLAGSGAVAIETDTDLEGGYLGNGTDGLRRVLYLPYSFAASSRNCLIKAEAGVADDRCFTKGLAHSCNGACRGELHPVHRSDTSLPLWRSGNTVFFEVPEFRAKIQIGQADRIVLQESPAL